MAATSRMRAGSTALSNCSEKMSGSSQGSANHAPTANGTLKPTAANV